MKFISTIVFSLFLLSIFFIFAQLRTSQSNQSPVTTTTTVYEELNYTEPGPDFTSNGEPSSQNS